MSNRDPHIRTVIACIAFIACIAVITCVALAACIAFITSGFA